MKNTLIMTCLALATGACAGSATETLTLSFSNLEDLGSDYVYEGWLIVDGAPVSTGRFSVNAAGELSQSEFDVDRTGATKFVLTIEPAVGDDPAAADTHVVAGDFSGDSAALSIGDGAALGTDFSSALGSFILATPTDAAAPDSQGIWWLQGDPAEAGLTLPTLPAGWAYEGWVVDVSGAEPSPISTGTFTVAAGADSDAGGPDAGTAAAPPFPGQDFVATPRDLTANHMAVISVEPSPDYSAAPYAIKPLAGMIGTDLAPTVQTMGVQGSQGAPSGSASF